MLRKNVTFYDWDTQNTNCKTMTVEVAGGAIAAFMKFD